MQKVSILEIIHLQRPHQEIYVVNLPVNLFLTAEYQLLHLGMCHCTVKCLQKIFLTITTYTAIFVHTLWQL